MRKRKRPAGPPVRLWAGPRAAGYDLSDHVVGRAEKTRLCDPSGTIGTGPSRSVERVHAAVADERRVQRGQVVPGEAVTKTTGTRGLPGRLYRTAVCPGCCTLAGLSAMFISVAITTVYSVAPASRSLMKRAHIPDRVRCLPVPLPDQLCSSW